MLAYLSATEAHALMSRRELSPVELLTAVIDRAEEVEPRINAFTERLYDSAMEQARRAESAFRNGTARPLEGIPVAVKEEQPIEGRTHEEGSLLFKGTIATVTHPVVTRIVAAGGIVHARTATPEFSCAAFTHSRLWGVTRNPWNLDYSPGGSSGGSGASLAAGTSLLATGSDIGGSIRIPASFCGVVGFKPPFGRVPALPPFNLDQYCHDGPMARTVGDVALLQNVIAGPHPWDVVSLRPKLELPRLTGDVRGLRVALSLTLGDYLVEPDVVTGTLAAAQALRAAGAIVEEVELPWTRKQIMAAADAHFAGIFGAGIGHLAAEHADLLTDYAREFAMTRSELGFYQGLELEGEIYRPLGELLEDYDALLCPTTAVPAFPAEHDGGPLAINGELGHYMLGVMTIPFNIASRCPVLSVPSGLAANGVPTGVQVVGRTYDDVTVFELAAALEAALPGIGHPA
ncbi:amidase [Nonomuraea africana]|uniref:Aspartyl-tRNA(Asn)/glutamyl-tRNA(Gln) amidotransferase subunit A n=1 Tax=Nonomuraea africana TaxID=46171 RepID=A0ABR9KB73_9ACTN|nr:amidase [Nonomuraea africana]MBE1559262.1 aspartyl-tRNA(Asn)/glutamyl-tRNA(Gln) amidotransferase subunit A [Nonomuraea africana]